MYNENMDTTATKLVSKLIELTLYSRKATATDNGSFGLKERLLFCLLESSLPTGELMERLCMVKSNFALLANKCISENLIVKQHKQADKRSLVYSLTDNGRQYIQEIMQQIAHKFDTVLTGEEQIADAENKLNEVTELLSYLP